MSTTPDPCAVAHGADVRTGPVRTLVAVFASPVSERLLSYAGDVGYRPVLVEPDPARAAGIPGAISAIPELDDGTDVVVTDHHRGELGALLRDSLAHPARWIGVLGNPRHEGPHVAALTELGVPDGDIARVHRPVGLNIGSRAPAEIAISVIAGLIADRNGRPGGFEF